MCRPGHGGPQGPLIRQGYSTGGHRREGGKIKIAPEQILHMYMNIYIYIYIYMFLPVGLLASRSGEPLSATRNLDGTFPGTHGGATLLPVVVSIVEEPRRLPHIYTKIVPGHPGACPCTIPITTTTITSDPRVATRTAHSDLVVVGRQHRGQK